MESTYASAWHNNAPRERKSGRRRRKRSENRHIIHPIEAIDVPMQRPRIRQVEPRHKQLGGSIRSFGSIDKVSMKIGSANGDRPSQRPVAGPQVSQPAPDDGRVGGEIRQRGAHTAQ
jgi:hypothetical protein